MKKKIKKVSMPESEYRRLRRLEDKLLRAKNHIRIAWQTIKQVKELEK